MTDSALSAAEQTPAGRTRPQTVNALVRDFLTELANQEDRVRKARGRIAELSERSTARIGSRAWTREELHEC